MEEIKWIPTEYGDTHVAKLGKHISLRVSSSLLSYQGGYRVFVNDRELKNPSRDIAGAKDRAVRFSIQMVREMVQDLKDVGIEV